MISINDSEIMKLKFIGKSYRNLREKELIIKNLDEFSRRKLIWLNELYINSDLTIVSYWRIYNKYVHEYEVAKNQDVMNFTSDEIKGIILANFTIRSTTQKTIKTVVSSYLNWCINKKYININLANMINVSQLATTSDNILTKMTLTIKELDEMLYLLDKNPLQQVPLQESIVLLLGRYGFEGRGLTAIDLKFSDIDYDNKCVNIIHNNTIISRIPIDDIFIKWIKELERRKPYQPYVLMCKDKKGNLKQVTSMWIATRTHLCCEVLQQINIKGRLNSFANTDLQKTRIIDYLLRIRMEKFLRVKDIANVCSVFYGTKLKVNHAKVATMKKLYNELTGNKDLIISIKNQTQAPKKFNADCLEKLAIKYKIDLDYIYKNVPLITDENLYKYLPCERKE